jgi:aminocarboxymuconate-semialdehyde decarboxylase
METTLAAAHMVLNGTMTRRARLRMLLAHGGGAIVPLSGRLRHGQQAVAAAGPPPADPEVSADRMVRHVLFESVVHDSRLLRDLVAAVGPDRVLLGSDNPFDMADHDPVATVRAAGLDETVPTAVLHTNAERELRRTTGPGEHRG